ncbi:hypothetical protein JTB14_021216 [Gonioctena quinquepunctata]|nr:hypothetical protein JTB14_021216 [Gonioctena quinquepunctata]
MVRNYKRKTDRANISTEDLRKAINEVITHKRKIRDAATMYNIKESTLHFHLKKAKPANKSDSGNDSDDHSGVEMSSSSKYASQQVFSSAEETKASSMNFGLTYLHTRSLAFQFAKIVSKKYPLVWNDNQIAGIEWMRYGPEGISEPSSSTQSDNHKTCEPSTSEQPDDDTCEPIANTSKSDFVLENTVMTEPNCRSSINESSKNNTLDSIRPFPVLQPKTDNKRGRKKGKSCIFTSTPEMKRIQEEENIKQAKRREQELKRAKTVKRQLVKKTNALGVTTKKTPEKKQTYSNSSNSDVDMENTVSSDSNIDLCSEYGDVNELLDDECIEVEDFVLVEFPTKKKVVYYVLL